MRRQPVAFSLCRLADRCQLLSREVWILARSAKYFPARATTIDATNNKRHCIRFTWMTEVSDASTSGYLSAYSVCRRHERAYPTSHHGLVGDGSACRQHGGGFSRILSAVAAPADKKPANCCRFFYAHGDESDNPSRWRQMLKFWRDLQSSPMCFPSMIDSL